ncbi:MAG: HAD family hydrolase [Pseudomonadales bacterium]|jgi:HAD superfamily hydrolase (TIGR01549 family)
MIKVIGFDLDNTLWPVKPAILGAEKALAAHLRSLHPDIQYPHPQSAVLRDELIAQDPSLSFRLTALRREVLSVVIREIPALRETANKLADEAMIIFLRSRSLVTPYAAAETTLAELSQTYALCALTNGNADLSRIAIGQYFDFVRSAEEEGAPKPEPALFLYALSRVGCEPHEMVYVGDDPDLDIRAAASIGLKTVWFQSPDGRPVSPPPPYDEVVHHLEELPDAIARLNR